MSTLDSPSSRQPFLIWSSSCLLGFTGATISTGTLVHQGLHVWYSRTSIFGLDISGLDSNLIIEYWNESSAYQSGMFPIDVDTRH